MNQETWTEIFLPDARSRHWLSDKGKVHYERHYINGQVIRKERKLHPVQSGTVQVRYMTRKGTFRYATLSRLMLAIYGRKTAQKVCGVKIRSDADTIKRIKTLAANGVPAEKLASKFNVGISSVNRWITGMYYADIRPDLTREKADRGIRLNDERKKRSKPCSKQVRLTGL